ncbi:FYVE, RhoGEF and PH domain-containing protein 5 [Oryzias melastigma]|uniref:FYVE, RhoGEF and PH domain-containing protein 5 n=1 Tax=Oryzias melastigma TaxID=30732 RepID=A0A834CMP6_ORYME|nr:FYVE, RhoGEF and PH domain-containing protein 5 [Oryzias melastigma]
MRRRPAERRRADPSSVCVRGVLREQLRGFELHVLLSLRSRRRCCRRSFSKMNADCTKPSVAPKPRIVCHDNLKPPSSPASAARRPKPSIAPKPKATVLLNGSQERIRNGIVPFSHDDDKHIKSQNKVVLESSPSKRALKADIFRSPPTHSVTVTEEETEEDGLLQEIIEDWRLSDNALTDEADSLETLWLSEARLTVDSEGTMDTEATEDTDAEAFDAGEALADTEGLSVEDLSVGSAEEEASKESSAEGFPEDSVMNADAVIEEKEEDHCGFTCTILKLRCGQTTKAEDQQDACVYDFRDDDHEQVCEVVMDREPYCICGEDIIISKELKPEDEHPEIKFSTVSNSLVLNGKCEENEKEEYLGFGDRVRTEDVKFDALGNKLNNLSFRQNAVLAETDTSLTSSLSESQLLSPNISVFEDEDAHIVPFLDDTEQDTSNLYEGFGSLAQTGFPFTTRIPSPSLSQRNTNHMADTGATLFQKSYKSGLRPPPKSSSPMLNSTRHKSLTKPNYLSLYSRSLSMEGQDAHLYVHRDGSPRQRGALCSSDSFSRSSPQSSSALSTPTSLVDIPPPFELAYITKRPITKSSPSLLTVGDSTEKNRKKKSSIKRFLMLKFGWKTDKQTAEEKKPSADSSRRLLELDRHSLSSSPRLNSRPPGKPLVSPEPASSFLFYQDSRRKGNSVAFLNRSVVRVESFEDRSRVPFTPLPLTKPRSISFPNTDTSDYENVPPISSDYENVQVPHWRAARMASRADFFERPFRAVSSANETDGYVDMSSLPGFEKKSHFAKQDSESVSTDEYVVPVAVASKVDSTSENQRDLGGEEDQGRTSGEEDGGMDNYDRQPDGQSRAFYVVMDLVETERAHVDSLKRLQEDFRDAVASAVGDEGQPVLDDGRLGEILNELPDVYVLHRKILNELEYRIRHWEDSQRIADIFLSRKAEFLVFTTYIGHFDRSMSLLENSCQTSPAFAAIVQKFEEQSSSVGIKQQLLQVIVRVARYRMLLTDYLNNLSPDSREYEDTQAAVGVVSDIADQINDNIQHGENLLRLINIAHSVHGQRDLLHPGRVFVKEGTLMKVSRKSRQPRHLFLMNDVLLYTYPQQNGKYRLKNTLSLTGLKVSKPTIENAPNALKLEGADISIILSASSFLEREDWFYTLSRTASEHARGSAFNSCSGEVNTSSTSRPSLMQTCDRPCVSVQSRDGLKLLLGEKAPTLVPVSQVMMCMNCTADFSLTLRRHHCHGCGRIVCRSCSRNRYPLKYMKDRMAKVCDRCYSELKKRGGEISELSGSSSPRLHRSSRPLSTVFQNIHPHNIWRNRKGIISFTQVTVSEEGSISGTLQRSKKSKKNWKRLWFLLKDKVLYTYRAQEERIASESLPLLGFTVKLSDKHPGDEETNVFQLYHKETLFYSFKAEDNFTAQRWVNAMEEATNL